MNVRGRHAVRQRIERIAISVLVVLFGALWFLAQYNGEAESALRLTVFAAVSNAFLIWVFTTAGHKE